MKLKAKQKITINELIKYIEQEIEYPVIDFDMNEFYENSFGMSHNPKDTIYSCDTSCCLLGLHACHSKTRKTDWNAYADLVGIQSESNLWYSLFSERHSSDFNHALIRCKFILENDDSEIIFTQSHITGEITKCNHH